MLKKVLLTFICLIPFIKVEALGEYPLTIQKHDQFGSQTVGTFKFKIRNIDTGNYILDNGKEVMETMWDGRYHSYFKLGPGTYEIQNAECPKDYFPLEQNTQFTIDENTPLVGGRYIVNDFVKKVVGKIEISRFGNILGPNKQNIMRPISGVRYQIYAEHNIIDDSGNVLFEKDHLMDTITTNEKGVAESIDLPLGFYYIKEISLGPGYEKYPDKQRVTFNNQEMSDVILYRHTFTTDHKPLHIKVNTLNEDSVDSSIFKEIHFKLWQKETDECITDYSFKKNASFNLDYGEYYLEFLIGNKLIEKYNHTFTQKDDLWEITIDFGKSKVDKDEGKDIVAFKDNPSLKSDVVLTLPKTGNTNWNLAYYLDIILFFLLLIGIKKLKNPYS